MAINRRLALNTPYDLTTLIERARALLRMVEFEDYRFIVHLHSSETVQLYAEYDEADVYTRQGEIQRTRKWNLTPQMSDSEIVQTAFKLCLTSMEHRTREAFVYKGARIFGPHFNVDDLVQLCRDGRENAGARKA